MQEYVRFQRCCVLSTPDLSVDAPKPNTAAILGFRLAVNVNANANPPSTHSRSSHLQTLTMASTKDMRRDDLGAYSFSTRVACPPSNPSHSHPLPGAGAEGGRRPVQHGWQHAAHAVHVHKEQIRRMVRKHCIAANRPNLTVSRFAVIIAVQNWLSESPNTKSASSQPAVMSVGTSCECGTADIIELSTNPWQLWRLLSHTFPSSCRRRRGTRKRLQQQQPRALRTWRYRARSRTLL